MMTAATADATRRRFVYAMLITVAAGGLAGRILSIRQTPIPTFGSNDRSRWATIRALVDDGTYAIGRRDPAFITDKNKHGDTGIVQEAGWETIDKVLMPDSQTFYSSKPPLLPTVLAGEYWVLKHVFGLSITDPAGVAVRIILFTVNWLPLIFYLCCLSRLVELFGTTDWGRFYVMFAACFATFLTPFSVSLNNHTVASWSALFALYFAIAALTRPANSADVSPSTNRFGLFLGGLFAGFAACTELPAAALAAALLVVLLYHCQRPTLAWFVPALIVPVAGLLFTNYLALGRITLAYADFGGPAYEYPGSHWLGESGQQGIDWAWTQETNAEYAFHLLLGHHGLFSLSPIFLLALIGIAMWLRTTSTHRVLAGITCAVTLIVVGFYLFVTDERTHNYGGWTSGPRQLMWLTPLLLLTMVPCADRLAASRSGRILGYLILGISTLSVSYPPGNPWRHPWIYDFMNWYGWITY